MLDRQEPLVPTVAHDGLEVAVVSQVPRVLARSAVQDGECPQLRRLTRRSGVWCIRDGRAEGDGSERWRWRWRGAWRNSGHVDGELPDFGLAGKVFDGCGVEEDELEGAAAHAE